MPKILVTETAVIEKYGINEKIDRFDTGADYVICQSDVLYKTGRAVSFIII